MANNFNKKTVKNATIYPFDLPSGNVWEKIDYRYDSAESWRNALEHSFIVLPNTLQDVRFDASHALHVVVDVGALRVAGIDSKDVDLVVLVRDNFSKNVITLKKQNLGVNSELLVEVGRHDLEATSLVRRVDFEVMLLALNDLELKGRKVRRAARIAKHVITVSAESQGLSFNFRKTSPHEFVSLGLPGATTFHIDLKDAADLTVTCDDVSSVLKVLVHEDAWLTLQEIRSGDQVGEALGIMMGAHLLFVVLAAIKTCDDINSDNIEEGSILKRILTWLAATGDLCAEELQDIMFDDGGLAILQAHVQDALKLTRGLKRVNLEMGEIE